MEKICNCCGLSQILEEFYKEESGKYGRRAKCKACMRLESRRPEVKERRRRSINKEKERATQKRYIEKNKQKHLEYQKQWRLENTEKLREMNKGYAREYRKNPDYRLASNLSRRMRDALKYNKKNCSTVEYLGCTIEEFKIYAAKLFTEGMTWELYNQGKIEMDHILPCCSFDLSVEENRHKCFHYSNLRPLWTKDNRHKISQDRKMSIKKRKIPQNSVLTQ